MSIGISQAAFNRYTTNSATFSITFPRHNENEVRAYVEDVSTGVLTALALTTDYTLSGILPASGSATLTLVDNGNPLPDQAWLDSGGLLDNAAYSIIIEYVPAGKQENSFANLGRFAPVSFEKSLDQLTMTVKAQERILGRTIQFLPKDITDSYDPVFPTTIVGNADKVIAVNDTEDGIKYGPTTASIFQAVADAAASAGNAATSETNAAASEVAAGDAQTAAEAAQAAAELAQTGAELAETNAGVSETNAAASAVDADFSATLDVYTTTVQVASGDSPVTITSGDDATLYVVDSTGGDVTFNLPVLSGLASTWKVGFLKAVDAANNIIVVPNGAETVNAGASISSSDIGVGVLIYPNTATDWFGYYYTAGFTPGGAVSGGGGLTVVGTQSIAAAGQITLNVISIQQALKVQGNAGAQTTGTAPFSTTPADGTLIVLVGVSDAAVLEIPYADVAGGCLIKGDCFLGANDTLTLIYDSTSDRYFEMARN